MLKFSGWPRLTWGRGPSARGCGRVWSRGWIRAAECGRDVRSATDRLSTPTRRVAPHGVLLFPPTARRGLGHGRPFSAPRPGHGNAAGAGGDGWRDAQAGVPSAEWPRAQLAFKDSMVHGILQFTPSIAFRYVLHRCESRDIRCRESSKRFTDGRPVPAAPGGAAAPSASIPWRSPRPEGCSELVGTRVPGSSPGPRAASGVIAGLVRRWWFQRRQ